ncbi:hypothetical protein B0H13DRAFT_1903161 [Mycena leptocephala]|nr:hypothetical protein B0H13DRAFT_1903161 [Mycena leptocephala]
MATVFVVEIDKVMLCTAKPTAFGDFNSDLDIAREFNWDSVLLPMGSVFFLRPKIPFVYYILEPTVIQGFSAFVMSTSLLQAFDYPFKLLTVLPLLSRIFNFWYINQDLEAQGSDFDLRIGSFINNHVWGELLGILLLACAALKLGFKGWILVHFDLVKQQGSPEKQISTSQADVYSNDYWSKHLFINEITKTIKAYTGDRVEDLQTMVEEWDQQVKVQGKFIPLRESSFDVVHKMDPRT